MSLPGDVLHRLGQMATENLRKVVAEASSCEKFVKSNLIVNLPLNLIVNLPLTNEGNKSHGKEGGVLVAELVRDVVNDEGGDHLPESGTPMQERAVNNPMVMDLREVG